MLALQHAAGNRAVARMLAGTRRLSRAPVELPQLGDPPLASGRVEVALRAWTGGLGWWRADELAAALTQDDMRSLTFDQRALIVVGIAAEQRIDGTDEMTVINLLTTAPPDQAGPLLSRLRADDAKVLRQLDAGIHGENYRIFHLVLRDLALRAVTLSPNAPEVPWANPGLISTMVGNDRIFYDKLELGPDGRVQIESYRQHVGFPPRLYNRLPPRDFDPFALVRVRFEYAEPEMNAVAGDVLVVPAVNLLQLGNRQFWSETSTAVDVGFLVGGGVNIVGATTRKALAWGALDVALGTGSLTVNEFRAQIAAAPGGREFVEAWDLAQYALLGYAVGRGLVEAPRTLHRLWRSCRPRVVLGEATLLRIDAEVEAAEQSLAAQRAGRTTDALAADRPPAPAPQPAAPDAAPAPAPRPPAPDPPAPHLPEPTPDPIERTPIPNDPPSLLPDPTARPQAPIPALQPPAAAPTALTSASTAPAATPRYTARYPPPSATPPAATPGRIAAQAALRSLKKAQWDAFERIQVRLNDHDLTWADAGISDDMLAALVTRPDFDRAMRELGASVNRAIRVRGLHAVEQLKDPQLYPDISEEGLQVRPEPRLPERSRLPQETELQGQQWGTPTSGGFWGGPEGNSPWYSDIEAVNLVTGGRPVIFRHGYPDFNRYVQARAWLRRVTGIDHIDFAAANRALARQNGWVTGNGRPIAARAQAWMDANHLTWHHHQDHHTMLAVPTPLHENVPHIGGAARR